MMRSLLNGVVKFLTNILLRIDDSELEKVPREGPLISVANHINFLDVPVIISHLHPRPTTGLVKKENWEHPFFKFLFTTWDGIPIDRDIMDFTAFKLAKQALDEKKILAVSPEGTRTEDGNLIRGKPGISLLASQVDVPILPMAYWGHENFSTNFKHLKRSPMKIKVGRRFKINFEGRRKSKELMQDVADAIMLEIAKLLPEKYHGFYTNFHLDSDDLITYLD